MITLLVATRNTHKVEEIGAILGSDFTCVSLKEFPAAPNVVEDADSFAGNATKKALALAHWICGVGTPDFLDGGYVLADDSGLEVNILGGAPGVKSARFAAADPAAGNSTDSQNNQKLLHLLQEVPIEKRTARFRCVLALCPLLAPEAQGSSPVCYSDELELGIELFEGACEGRIAYSPSGLGGFGYDPLFIPNGYSESFAQLGESAKNVISHRAKALAKLKERFVRPPG